MNSINKKMKAVIDMGTNTFHLLIGEVNTLESRIIYKHTIPVKLGEGGGISKGEIIPVAYHRGLEALQEFREVIDKHQINHVRATATAAIRDAKNGADFIESVYQLTQIKVEVISGKQEAEYIYRGARAAGALNEEKALIVDIGGGSTELIIASNEKIFWKDSFQIGAARLLSDFYNSDPISPEDIHALDNHFNNVLSSFAEAIGEFKPTILIGTAGSFDSFRDMVLLQEKLEAEYINYTFDKAVFTNLLARIIRSTHEQRTYMQGLIPLRTDMILMSSLLTKHLLDHTSIDKIIACSYSLKEGLLFSED